MKALTQCKYPKWALDKVEKKLNKSSSEAIDGANNQGTTGAQVVTNEIKTKGHIVEVGFLWNRTLDSLMTSFHPLP